MDRKHLALQLLNRGEPFEVDVEREEVAGGCTEKRMITGHMIFILNLSGCSLNTFTV